MPPRKVPKAQVPPCTVGTGCIETPAISSAWPKLSHESISTALTCKCNVEKKIKM